MKYFMSIAMTFHELSYARGQSLSSNTSWIFPEYCPNFYGNYGISEIVMLNIYWLLSKQAFFWIWNF